MVGPPPPCDINTSSVPAGSGGPIRAKPKADWAPTAKASIQKMFFTERNIRKFMLSIVRNKSHRAALTGTKEKSKTQVILLEQHTLEGHRSALARPHRQGALDQSALGVDT